MRSLIYNLFSVICVMTLLTSCGAESKYSGHQCYFIFNTTYHPSSILMASVTPPTGDGFCLVYKGMHNGYEKVFVEKYGTSDQNSPYVFTTSTEPKVSELVIGWDNGLLIGYSAIEGKLLAFDRHCKRCENNAKAKLQWNGSAQSVKCPVCGTVYDLTVSGNGLDYYPAFYVDSAFGWIVRVVN